MGKQIVFSEKEIDFLYKWLVNTNWLEGEEEEICRNLIEKVGS